MALYEFSFASVKLAIRSLRLIADKIKRVGYFSIKDAATFKDDIRPRLLNRCLIELSDFDKSEFFGWTDIRNVTIECRASKTSDPKLPAESETYVLCFPHPIYILAIK